MRRKELCTYCDKPAKTADHVPPKLLFARPRPQLITVPSCLRCNQAASLDDEYFRAVIAIEEKAGEHPDAKRLHDTVFRSLQKPQKRRFRRALLSGIREVDRRTPSGLYLGKAPSYSVDLDRLTRVIERITRGLFLHHTKRRLPLDCGVKSFATGGFPNAEPEVLSTILELVEQTRANPMHTIGNDVFCYRYSVANDQENSSAWILVVYRAISFVSITLDLTHLSSHERST